MHYVKWVAAGAASWFAGNYIAKVPQVAALSANAQLGVQAVTAGVVGLVVGKVLHAGAANAK